MTRAHLCEKRAPAVELPDFRVTASALTDTRGAAAYLGTSERSLRRWRKEKTGPAYTELGSRIWYELVALDDFIASCRHEH